MSDIELCTTGKATIKMLDGEYLEANSYVSLIIALNEAERQGKRYIYLRDKVINVKQIAYIVASKDFLAEERHDNLL